ncbi:MAG: aldehyde dehydrogenase family protein [Hyphomicrobiaceae bacterium]
MSRVPGFRDGKDVVNAREIAVNNPYDNSQAALVCADDEHSVRAAVASARSATRGIRTLPTHRRSDILRRVATLMSENAAEMAASIVSCTGKTITESKAEVDRAPDILTLSAEEARRITTTCPPGDAIPTGNNRIALILREPVGVVASITPFNAPLNSFCHKVAPAFAAGNAIVAKPDLRGAKVAVMMAHFFHEAGAPPGFLNVVHGEADVGHALVTDPGVDFIGFTGSTRAALEIQKVCGLRRTQFELGGNAATIVHDDAKWEQALPALLKAAFGLSGQSCISLQRLLVHRDIYTDFTKAFIAGAKKLKVGDPSRPETDVGPVVSEYHANRICQWADEAASQGGTLALGGGRKGALVDPIVLIGTKATARTMCDEVFGPLVNIVSYDDIDQALQIVNASRFGLQAGILTSSLDIALRVARELHTGGVVVNGPSRQRLDHLPYGGRGDSGLGREGPAYAIAEMTEMKTVVVNM